MAQCTSPTELAETITKILDNLILNYLNCGVLQAGLNACNEPDVILPRNTQIVLCRQLADLVQQGIDDGSIVAPTLKQVYTNETEMVFVLANGEELRVDLTTAVNHIIDSAFTDCDNKPIPVGSRLVICEQLSRLVQDGINTGEIVAPTVIRVETNETELVLTLADGNQLKVDLTSLTNHVIADAFNDCNGNPIPVGTAIATCANVDDKFNEFENAFMKEFWLQLKECCKIYHDDSLIGGGKEDCPLGVNEEWLEAYLNGRNKDCNGEPIVRDIPLATCQNLQDAIDELPKFTNCKKEPLQDGEQLVTCEELEEALANIEGNSFVDCKGEKINNGTALASCEDLTETKDDLQEQINNIPKFTDCKQAALVDGQALASCEDLTEVKDDLQAKIDAIKVPQFLDCNLNPLEDGTDIATCGHVTELYDDLRRRIDPLLRDLVDCKGGEIYSGDAIASCENLTEVKDDLQAKIDAIQIPSYVDCKGQEVVTNTAIATCIDLQEAIAGIEGSSYIDCQGEGIPNGAYLATCLDLQNVQMDLEEKISNIKIPQYVDCQGTDITADDRIATCADLERSQDYTQGLIDAIPTTAYTDCNGVKLDRNEAIATCAHVDEIKEDLQQQIDAIPTTAYMNCNGVQLDRNEALATCADVTIIKDDLQDQIDNLVIPHFNNCAGEEVSSGTAVVQCSEFATKLKEALIPLELQIESQRGITKPYIKLMGYSFSAECIKPTKSNWAYTEIYDLDTIGRQYTIGYVWTERDPEYNITVPVYECNGEVQVIIGYASTVPYLINDFGAE